MYVKPTDRHQYLHYTSSHPNRTKRSIVYSQGLRIQRICTEKNDFLGHMEEMKSWFLRRGYPKDLIETEQNKVYIPSKSKSCNQKGVPLVVTYHPLLQDLNSIINKYIYLLYADEEVKITFSPKPMISFRSARKLSSYLVRAELYPIERRVGSFQCKSSGCKVCLNVVETNSSTSTTTGLTYKINHKFDCDSKCVIYLLSCRVCNMQYVGSTVVKFRFR